MTAAPVSTPRFATSLDFADGRVPELLRVAAAPLASQPEPDARLTLTARKRDHRFTATVTKSALGDGLYQMRRYGWTVTVSGEHRA